MSYDCSASMRVQMAAFVSLAAMQAMVSTCEDVAGELRVGVPHGDNGLWFDTEEKVLVLRVYGEVETHFEDRLAALAKRIEPAAVGGFTTNWENLDEPELSSERFYGPTPHVMTAYRSQIIVDRVLGALGSLELPHEAVTEICSLISSKVAEKQLANVAVASDDDDSSDSSAPSM